MKYDIFVFGSNLAGRNGLGAAKYARLYYGAKYGEGIGITGQSYAIPTKDENLRVLSLHTIHDHIIDFIEYARNHEHLTFKITRVGCGLAGYKDSDIAKYFKGSPINCYFDLKWKEFLGEDYSYWGTY